MKDIRPYICRKLKEMRESGKPVWIGKDGRRYLIAPFDPWGDDWPLWGQGWFLIKGAGRYHISWVHERCGRVQISQRPHEHPVYASPDNVLAIVLEIHPYDGIDLAPNDPETMAIHQRQAEFWWGKPRVAQSGSGTSLRN